MKTKFYKSVLILILVLTNIPLLSLANNEERFPNSSQTRPPEVPKIDFFGPDNIPVQGLDLISYTDEQFEINFGVVVETSNIWVDRIYGFTDFDTQDTNLLNSNRFVDGETIKIYSTGETPPQNALDPDLNFMGEERIKIFEDRNEWTRNKRFYNAKLQFPGKIDNEIFFNIKILYHSFNCIPNGGTICYHYFTYNVAKFYLNDYTTLLSLRIVDDDNKAPTILESQVKESKVFDNMDSITINTIAIDNSGIDETYVSFQGVQYYDDDKDGLISIPNPKIPQEYEYTTVVIDGDKDREGDQLSTTIFNSFQVYDDDIKAPIINAINIVDPPVYDGEDEIEFSIDVADESGISELFLEYDGINYYDNDGDSKITIPNPKSQRIHYFSVTAIDGDNDYIGDSLTTKINSNFEILDDDVDPPNISNIAILNAPITDSSADIQFQIEVNDFSGISQLYIEFLGLEYFDDDLDGFLTLPNPKFTGKYDINITVIDDDNDLGSDKQSVTTSFTFNIFDDDSEGPVIKNVTILNAPVYDSNNTLELEIIIEDYSGLSELYIEFMGTFYYDLDLDGYLTISSPNVAANYDLMIYAVDNDTDLADDSLTTSSNFQFEILDDDDLSPTISGIEILNSPIMDSTESIEFYVNASDYSGISEIFINFMGSIYNDTELDGFITIPNPIEPGDYLANVTVVDDDQDSENDTSTTITNYSFKIFDDDVNKPHISSVDILNTPLYDYMNNVIIEVTAEDDSGISSICIEFQGSIYNDFDHDGIISFPNPVTPGIYIFMVNVTDADNERLNDKEIESLYFQFEVQDDDISSPDIKQISILNSPIYDSSPYIDIDIEVEDESGISDLYIDFEGSTYHDNDKDKIIRLPSPINLGDYSFTVHAVDNDTDRLNDQLASFKTFSFTVKDDDAVAPIISEINILNGPIYDSSEFIDILIDTNDESGISELYIEFLGQKYYDNDDDYILRLPNPIYPSQYEFSVFVKDADSDRPEDELSTSLESTFDVFDDDVTAPQIIIFEEVFGWSFFISDQDGIVDSNATGFYTLYDDNGSIWDIGTIEEEQKIYYVKIPFKPGNYFLEINATNNDLEWSGDEEIVVQTNPKNISLEYCFLFVDQKIEALKDYVDKQLCSILAASIRYNLIQAQEYLRDAFEKVLEGDLTCSLFKDSMVKVLLKITEFETKFFDKLNLVKYEVAEKIISDLHEIRDFIIMLMGHSVDYIKQTVIGFEIALIDVDLLNLKDFLYNQPLSCKNVRYLRTLISMAACQLESTFFKLSLDLNISCTLSLVQKTLLLAEDEVYRIFDLGIVPETIAIQIVNVLEEADADIQGIKETF